MCSRRVNGVSTSLRIQRRAPSQYHQACSTTQHSAFTSPFPEPPAHQVTMASFFDLKARKAAAAANGNSEQKQEKAPSKAQPWVEK